MDKRIKYLLKNTSIFAIGEFGTKLIAFFLVPFYTHILTTEEYGTIDLIFTISTVIVPLVMLNIGEAIMRYALDKDADYNKLLSIGICSIGFGFLISLLIFPIVSQFAIISEYVVYIYLYIVFQATKTILTCYLRGKEQLKEYVGCNILNTFSIALLNILFLVVLKRGITGYLLAYIMSDVISIIYVIFIGKIYKDIKKIIIEKKLLKKMIGFSLAIVPNSMLWWAINSSDRIMVTSMVNVAENGILAVSYKIPSILSTLNNILMQAWKYSAIKEMSSTDRDKFANQMFYRFTIISFIASDTIIIFIKVITKVLFESSYYTSWESSIYLLIGFVLMGMGSFIGTIYYVEKNMIGNMLSALLGAIANILLNFLLIPKIGASGATLSSAISYLIILLFRYFDTKKYQNIQLFNKKYIVLFILTILMLIGCRLDNHLGIAIETISYIMVLIINYKFIMSLLRKLLQAIKKRIRTVI